MSSSELQCGLKQGWWGEAPRRKRSLEALFGFHLQVTPKGKSAFAEMSASYSPGYPAQVTLNKQYTRSVVQIGGITDFTPPLEGWSGKEVRFTWQWDWVQFPDMAKRCLTPPSPQEGTAGLRHYDDGWRVETFYSD